jgi:hypothetical protein
MPLDLNDDDKAALVELLREVIAADRYPLSPRIRKLRAILDKLVPPAPPARTASGTEAGGREAASISFTKLL